MKTCSNATFCLGRLSTLPQQTKVSLIRIESLLVRCPPCSRHSRSPYPHCYAGISVPQCFPIWLTFYGRWGWHQPSKTSDHKCQAGIMCILNSSLANLNVGVNALEPAWQTTVHIRHHALEASSCTQTISLRNVYFCSEHSLLSATLSKPLTQKQNYAKCWR